MPLVLGGIYARLCPEHAASIGADYIVKENWEPDVTYPAMDLYGTLPYGVTMTSFGCPLACEYCASHLLWPRYRPRKCAVYLSGTGAAPQQAACLYTLACSLPA